MNTTNMQRGEGMMVGKRFYSEADMMRMQRNAEERVLEMQHRARRTAQQSNGMGSFMPSFVNPNRNWESNPNVRRDRTAESVNTFDPSMEVDRTHDPIPEPLYGAPPDQEEYRELPPLPPHTQGGATIIDDVVGSLGLESDTILIIGLLLILINQKADTTLILALVYLLF